MGVRWEWGIGVFESESWMNDCVEETVNPAGSSSSFGQQGQQSRKDIISCVSLPERRMRLRGLEISKGDNGKEN